MARYIDAEELTDHMLERYSDLCDKHGDYDHYTTGYGDAIDAIENAPTADVVPKSEVERLTVELDAMRGAANIYKMHYENAIKDIERLKDYNTGVAFKHYFDGRKEAAREIFEEIEFDIHQLMFERDETRAIAIEGIIAELKKKYTGENTENENQN